MQTFQGIAPEGNLIIDTITGYPVGEATPAPQDSPVFDEFLALISKLQAAGYSVAGVVVKKDDETDTVVPFLCTAKGKEVEKEVETLRDAVHSLLHEESDETQKMIRLLVGVFLGGYSQYKLCTALSHEKDS